MANGFFLGGMAKGIESSRASRRADRQVELQDRALGLKEDIVKSEAKRKKIEAVDTEIANTMKIVSETIKAGLEAGRSPEEIRKAIGPLVKDVAELTELTGRDPSRVLSSIDVLLTSPGAVESASGTGTANAARRVAEANALAGAGVPASQAQATAGIAQPEVKSPNVQNYQMPDGSFLSVDSNAPDASRKVAEITANGGVRVGLSVQSGSADGLGINKSDQGKYLDSVTASLNAIGEIGRLREQLAEAETFTGLASTVVTTLSGAAGNMLQIARASGLDDSGLLDPRNYRLDGFGQAAASSAAFRSNVINMAYLMARAADPGGRLSNQDVQIQVDRLSASSGDKGQILASLDEVERGIKMAAQNRFAVTSGVIKNLPELPAQLKMDESGDKSADKEAESDPAVKDFKPPAGWVIDSMQGGKIVIRNEKTGKKAIQQ